ncbi:MAG: hypothetical protein K6C10_10585 [Prevotella sp.]|nr:hypothetical protein [Prevotella sp.]
MHRSIAPLAILSLLLAAFLLGGDIVAAPLAPAKGKRKAASKKDDKVYLVHANELRYDLFGTNPDAQIAKGKVHFLHQGAHLWCDSAYYYEKSNSVKAFGHVHFKQGDTLSLNCDIATYDGGEELMVASKNVVLKHRRQTLYTDSLTYDRLYKTAYFVEGGKLIDGKDKLVSDWGEYSTSSRQAVFYFDVKLFNGSRLVTTDTLYYDTPTSVAHVVGPSKVESEGSTIETIDGYFNTKTDQAKMYGRSTVVDKQKTITGDSLFYDDNTGESEGFGNVVYIDNENKNELNCEHLIYNEQQGYGYATDNALVKDFSQRDTLYMHGDSIKIFTFNINTDSVYRKVHCFRHVRAYRTDVQAICDSLVFNSQDSCMTMYQDPVVWNMGRQLLGEVIRVYMNDSTIRMAHVEGQALSVEKVDDQEHFNQISSKEMKAFFIDGKINQAISYGNVLAVYYPIDEKDTTIIVMDYTETDTMKMYFSPERKLEKIWMNKATGTWYPLTQIPPNRLKLEQFAWLDNLRPLDKNDIFVWRGKESDAKLKVIERHSAPLQKLEGKESEENPVENAPAEQLPDENPLTADDSAIENLPTEVSENVPDVNNPDNHSDE